MINSELIRTFYNSFSRHDAEGMVQCYADSIIFSDPAFGQLHGDDAKNMWRMLVQNSRGQLKISFSDVEAGEKSGSAKWIAEYTLSKTGRHVVNRISAHFEFADGKITKHNDQFDLWKWSAQALGWKGLLLGWTTFMKQRIQQQARSALRAYVKNRDDQN